jgi:hypothetical protein
MTSGVFKQNLYVGVYEELPTYLIPKTMNFFDINRSDFPHVGKLKDDGFMIEVTLEEGDCLYIPMMWYY